jgi:hypothetical protein
MCRRPSALQSVPKVLGFAVSGVVLALASASILGAQGPSRDSAEVRRVIGEYSKAQELNDSTSVLAAMSPKAHIYYVRGDTIASLTRQDYAAHFTGRGPADTSVVRTGQITNLVIDGPAASAMVVVTSARGRSHDYLALLRAGASWRIVAIWVQFTPTR